MSRWVLRPAIPVEGRSVTILKRLKQLTPLSARRFMKVRLPIGLVRIVASSPPPRSDIAGSGRKAPEAKGKPLMSGPVCPICGTALRPAQNQTGVICTECGSSSHHRRLALAVYANVRERTTRILALGPSQEFKAIFDDMDGVFLADDMTQVPSDLRARFDLCVHSHWPRASRFGPERNLREMDTWLSPQGAQIFSVDVPAGGWRTLRWRLNEQALIQWLRRKGWLDASTFDLDAIYGVNAEKLFGCAGHDNASVKVIVLSKLRGYAIEQAS